jgi:hypothetical protein
LRKVGERIIKKWNGTYRGSDWQNARKSVNEEYIVYQNTWKGTGGFRSKMEKGEFTVEVSSFGFNESVNELEEAPEMTLTDLKVRSREQQQ